MASLREQDISNIAKLARIDLSAPEQQDMKSEAGLILDFVEDLQKTDTSSVAPTSQVTGLQDVWREDKVVPSKIAPEDLLSQAPDVHDGYVKVKKVL